MRQAYARAMPVTIRVLSEPTIIETTFAGDLTAADVGAAAVAALEAARAHGTHLHLADCTPLIGRGDVFSVYDMVEGFDALGVDRRLREAVIVQPGTAAEGDLSFYETVARNRGYNVRLFVDRSQAMAWLREQDAVLNAAIPRRTDLG